MLSLILFFLILQTGLTSTLLVILWTHLPVWESIQGSLRMWDNPAHLAKPLPDPGVSWVPSDAELAIAETRLLQDSQARVTTIGRPVSSPRGFGRSRRPSPMRGA